MVALERGSPSEFNGSHFSAPRQAAIRLTYRFLNGQSSDLTSGHRPLVKSSQNRGLSERKQGFFGFFWLKTAEKRAELHTSKIAKSFAVNKLCGFVW